MGNSTSSTLCLNNKVVFEELFRSCYAPLCFFCEQIIQEEDAAKDIVEDLFVKLWQKEFEFDNLQHAQGYFYRAARNACLNFIKHGRVVEITHQILADTSDIADVDHLENMIRAEVWGELYRAIENLPAQCSKVITLSFLEGLTTEEIADEMKISVQTVRNTKVRALHALRETLPGNLLSLLLLYSLLEK